MKNYNSKETFWFFKEINHQQNRYILKKKSGW